MKAWIVLLVLSAPVLASADLPIPKRLPPYVPPLTVLDALHLPDGNRAVVRGDEVCYDAAAHMRLTMALHVVEALSDERARVAWLYGWQDASEVDGTRFDDEHAARLDAEARAEAAKLRAELLENAAGEPWWKSAGRAAVWTGLGALVGVVAWEIAR